MSLGFEFEQRFAPQALLRSPGFEEGLEFRQRRSRNNWNRYECRIIGVAGFYRPQHFYHPDVNGARVGYRLWSDGCDQHGPWRVDGDGGVYNVWNVFTF